MQRIKITNRALSKKSVYRL